MASFDHLYHEPGYLAGNQYSEVSHYVIPPPSSSRHNIPVHPYPIHSAHVLPPPSSAAAANALSLHPHSEVKTATGTAPLYSIGGNHPHFYEFEKTLYLGDLSYFCTEEDLYQLFSPYGTIATIKVHRGKSGNPLLHGFISFHSELSAKIALNELNGVLYMGRVLRIHQGVQQMQCREKLGIEDYNLAQVHVSFISKRMTGFLVTETILRDVFTQFGEVVDVTVKKHVMNPQLQNQSGYGFVYYRKQEEACRAVLALKHHTFYDITFDCTISHKALAKPNKYKKQRQQAMQQHHHSHQAAIQQLRGAMGGVSSAPAPISSTNIGYTADTLPPVSLLGLTQFQKSASSSPSNSSYVQSLNSSATNTTTSTPVTSAMSNPSSRLIDTTSSFKGIGQFDSNYSGYYNSNGASHISSSASTSSTSSAGEDEIFASFSNGLSFNPLSSIGTQDF